MSGLLDRCENQKTEPTPEEFNKVVAILNAMAIHNFNVIDHSYRKYYTNGLFIFRE